MFSPLKSNSCRGGLYNLDPNFNPPLNFPGQHQNHFFYFNRPMPPLKDHYRCKCPFYVAQWRPVKSEA